MIPFSKYPGLSPLFLEFLRGATDLYPDRPTVDACVERGRRLLEAGRRPRVPASAFRCRGPQAERAAEDLAAGRAVAVAAGHQVGLFSGPVFTLLKALDAIHLAREVTRRGVPAVAVFWALTDDHDLQEVARTARPTPDGPQELVLEGADRQNRQPVGRLRIPDGLRAIVEAFRPDAGTEESGRILDDFAQRSAPGTTYGAAFVETLLDLVAPDPLLVLDPLDDALRSPTVALFLDAALRERALRETLVGTEERLRASGRPVPAPLPDGFSFFTIDAEGRRRVEDVSAGVRRVRAGEAWPSADVITRPVLKSYLFPMAASVLGAAEIAYHAQSLPLFELFEVTPPVLIPRTHAVLRGPAERRLAEQLGIAEDDLLSAPADPEAAPVPEADAVGTLAKDTAQNLAALSGSFARLDASLEGALENAGKKIAYQFEQLADRARKAAERKEGVAANRRRRLAAAIAPGGVPAERVYTPRCGVLAWGRGLVGALRGIAGTGAEGVAVVDLGREEGGEWR
ncbi:MAG: bacillithiol biosynthesis protein BshC [Syntrophomonadaceae bacterium]